MASLDDYYKLRETAEALQQGEDVYSENGDDFEDYEDDDDDGYDMPLPVYSEDVENDRASDDVLDIMNDYSEVLKHMNSDVGYDESDNENTVNKGRCDHNDVKRGEIDRKPTKEAKLILLKKSKTSVKGTSITYEDENAPESNMKQYAAAVDIVARSVANFEELGFIEPKKYVQLSDAEVRHRRHLAEVTLKRKQEEEAIAMLAAKASRKRKKFKDALLAKALKSRNQSEEQEAIDEVTKSFDKVCKVNSLTEEEKDVIEEEKKEQLSAIRKKFKEQHKKMLLSLASKNKADEEKMQDEIESEEKKRQRHKTKIEKMIAMKEERERGELGGTFSMPAGSGLAAIRSHKTEDRPQGPETSPSDEMSEEQILEADRVKDLKRQQTKAQQEKVSSMLNAIAEQKKKDENEKKKQEERKKRRIVLLQERVLQESIERKQMMVEDKPRYQNFDKASTPVGETRSSSSSNKSTKITPEMASALANRLNAKQKTDGDASLSVPARDFTDWKRKNSVPPESLVFVMTGWYPCVKQALLDRGWYFNPDPTSPHADLKWTLRSMDVAQDTLLPWQLTNHFLKNVAITTKVGLLKSLRSLVWLADVTSNDILPRGYDLNNPQETQAFIDDFRCQEAESILKRVYKKATGLDVPVDPVKQEGDGLVGDTWTVHPTPRLADGDVNNVMVNKAIFEISCLVLERVLKPLEDNFIDEQTGQDVDDVVMSGVEWEILSNHDVFSNSSQLAAEPPEAVDAFLCERDDEKNYNSAKNKDLRKKKKAEQQQRDLFGDQLKDMILISVAQIKRIHHILSRLNIADRSQAGLNGKGDTAKNMWIVKPAAKSRGRGIMTFASLPKLLKYVDAGNGMSTQWIVQKYMENPLVIAQRKFDLRQWVLVTDWNPLTVHFYDECYARFSVEEYHINDDGMDNAFVHLVNNSIGKNSENFTKKVFAENGESVEGYMWSQQQFKEYINFKSGEDLMTTRIHPRMKEIAKWSLMCASEMIEHRKNSWELYGFDFMIDEDYNAWLIEINSSPACDYSTPVTERYVQKALVELLSVVLDLRQWESEPKKARGDRPDTGGWECVYKGPLLEMPAASFGTDLTLKGDAIKAPKRNIGPLYTAPSVSIKQQPPSPISSPSKGSSVSSSTNRVPKPPPAYFPMKAETSSKRHFPSSIINTSLEKNFNDSDDDGSESHTFKARVPNISKSDSDKVVTMAVGNRQILRTKSREEPRRIANQNIGGAQKVAVPMKVLTLDL